MRSASIFSPPSDRAIAAAAPPVPASARLQCRPFRVPGADRTLVLVDSALDQQRRVRACVTRGRARDDGLDRIVLVRHRRRVAAVGLRNLADLRLGEQNDVACDLLDRHGGCRQACGELPERCALGVPGNRRARAGRALPRRAATPRCPCRPARRASRPRHRAAPEAGAHSVALERRPALRAMMPPCSRRSSARPAVATFVPPSPSSDARRPGGRKDPQPPAARRRRGEERAARRALPRCRGCPGWSHLDGRTVRSPPRPGRGSPAPAARRDSPARGLRPRSRRRRRALPAVPGRPRPQPPPDTRPAADCAFTSARSASSIAASHASSERAFANSSGTKIAENGLTM